jgi:predicted dehydrogenase
MAHKRLGIAVIGSGRIGTLRARIAAKHPAVDFLAVSDTDPAKAKALAQQTSANVYSADNDEIIAHPNLTNPLIFK